MQVVSITVYVRGIQDAHSAQLCMIELKQHSCRQANVNKVEHNCNTVVRHFSFIDCMHSVEWLPLLCVMRSKQLEL